MRDQYLAKTFHKTTVAHQLNRYIPQLVVKQISGMQLVMGVSDTFVKIEPLPEEVQMGITNWQLKSQVKGMQAQFVEVYAPPGRHFDKSENLKNAVEQFESQNTYREVNRRMYEYDGKLYYEVNMLTGVAFKRKILACVDRVDDTAYMLMSVAPYHLYTLQDTLMNSVVFH